MNVRDLAAAFEAMTAEPKAREHMLAAADLAKSFEPRLYTVESVHER